MGGVEGDLVGVAGHGITHVSDGAGGDLVVGLVGEVFRVADDDVDVVQAVVFAALLNALGKRPADAAIGEDQVLATHRVVALRGIEVRVDAEDGHVLDPGELGEAGVGLLHWLQSGEEKGTVRLCYDPPHVRRT